MKTIAVLGTFDTKGAELRFVAAEIRRRGCHPLLIDTGGLGLVEENDITLTASQVAREAGLDLEALRQQRDRGAMVAAFSHAAPMVVSRLAAEGRLQGIISLGGSGGTAIGTAAMRALPLGVPKLMVSTVAGGNVTPYVGLSDIIMVPSIVDVAGLNRISRGVFARAAAAVCSMASTESAPGSTEGERDRPVVVASMFGNTTPCVEQARALLDAAGFEVIVFHATGVGGRAMESIIQAGWVSGVLDITTTEWADELVGGVLSAGPTRLEAAALAGVPAIVTPGCLDMVNFGPRESVPPRFSGRQFYPHNPHITLMRTTPSECAYLGRILAEKVNLSRGPVTVLLPMKGISMLSMPGQPFHDPEADRALFDGIEAHLRKDVPLERIDAAINDAPFAQACARALLAHLKVS